MWDIPKVKSVYLGMIISKLHEKEGKNSFLYTLSFSEAICPIWKRIVVGKYKLDVFTHNWNYLCVTGHTIYTIIKMFIFSNLAL